jgi:predicted RNase H-like HicB family nuclease
MKDGDRFVELTFKVAPEDDQYSAFCIELDLATCGDTLDEAQKNILEAVDVHLATLAEIGDLKRFLKDKGVQVKTYRRSRRTLPSREVNVSLGEWAQRSRVAVP